MSPRSVFGGKCAMHVRVTDYDPRWADLFAREAAAYGALKRELAARFSEDIEGYCDGKDAFVRGLERRALAWEAERAAGR